MKRKKPKYPYRDPRTLTKEELKRIDKADSIYFAAMRDFYNGLVPDELKAGKNTELLRITRTIGEGDYFGINSFGDDIMFCFLGNTQKKEPVEMLKTIIFNAGTSMNPESEIDRKLVQSCMFDARCRGFEPLKKKVLCIVQEESTEDFLDKDEIILDLNNKDFQDFAGEWRYGIIDEIKRWFGTTEILVKVINKVNNPESYKNYLTVKNIMDQIDKFGVIGL